jgi:hypothetical protein
LLDWIEIGAVGRQVDEGCVTAFDRLADAHDFVAGEIVHNDDIALRERGGEDLFDVGEENLAIHPIDDQRRGKSAGA